MCRVCVPAGIDKIAMIVSPTFHAFGVHRLLTRS